MPGIMLVGYDVEEPDPATTQHFLTQACRLHDDLGFPATLFVVGRTLQHSVPAFREIAQDPLFNLQQHTYSHKLLKTVCIDDGKSVRIVRGETLETIRDEVRRTNTLLAELLGITCTGITGPWCYYRGLRDRPDILELLWEEGIRFTRTDGRNAQDWHPVALDLQPYWYEAQGFPRCWKCRSTAGTTAYSAMRCWDGMISTATWPMCAAISIAQRRAISSTRSAPMIGAASEPIPISARRGGSSKPGWPWG